MGYWFTEWLESQGARSADDARKLFVSKRRLESLREAATSALPRLAAPVLTGIGLVAGRGIDLSGQLECSHPECRLKQVDKLLGSVWHYFDQVAVADPICRVLAEGRGRTHAALLEALDGQAQIALHLRKIGAEPLVVYQDKPLPDVCTVHWRHAAQTAGIGNTIDTAEFLVDVLSKTANFAVENTDDEGIHFRVDGSPYFEHTVWGTLPTHAIPQTRTSMEMQRAMAEAVVGRWVIYLASDLSAARRAGAPLGSALLLHRRLLVDSPDEATEAEVALHLNLPFLSGLDVPSLLKLRQQEREHFERFRRALTQAIDERRKAGHHSDPQVIARQVTQDLVEPELHRISERLKASAQTFTRKTAVGVSVGGLATTCGLLAGATPAVAVLAGAAAVGSALVGAAGKRIDDTAEIRLSSMYFLWKAKHSH